MHRSSTAAIFAVVLLHGVAATGVAGATPAPSLARAAQPDNYWLPQSRVGAGAIPLYAIAAAYGSTETVAWGVQDTPDPPEPWYPQPTISSGITASTDGGRTWTRISHQGDADYEPVAALFQTRTGTIAISPTGVAGQYLARHVTAAGETSTPLTAPETLRSTAVAPDGSLYAAGSDDTTASDDVDLTYSHDGGATWSTTTVAAYAPPKTGWDTSPVSVVATDGGAVVIAWSYGPEALQWDTAQQIWLARSLNGGVTFSVPHRVDVPTGGQAMTATLVADGAKVAVLWDERTSKSADTLLERVSGDNGARWSEPTTIMAKSQPAPTYAPAASDGALTATTSSGIAWLRWQPTGTMLSSTDLARWSPGPRVELDCARQLIAGTHVSVVGECPGMGQTYGPVAVVVSGALDAVAPVVTGVQPAAGTTVRTARVAVTWRGRDDGAGIASYAIRHRAVPRSGRAGRWVTRAGLRRAVSVLATRRRGYRYCYEVRASDKIGNVSAWTRQRCVTRH